MGKYKSCKKDSKSYQFYPNYEPKGKIDVETCIDPK